MPSIKTRLASIADDLNALGIAARELHASIHHETGRTQTQQAIAERVEALAKQIDIVRASAEETIADEPDTDDQGDDDQGDDDNGEGEHAEGAARPERARADARKKR